MSCLNPILIQRFDYRTNTKVFQQVRCRECEDCKQSARSAAFVRLNYEYKHCIESGGFALFFTLTFADEYVPFKFHRMCFDKVLVQNWLQHIRQEFRRKYGLRLTYFLVSELGHVGTCRPHHHGELFFYHDDKYQLKSWKIGKHKDEVPLFPESYCSIIRYLWTYGRCDIQKVDPSKGGHRYVSKYISKSDSEENLFKDIITQIQIRRGKGYPDTHMHYLNCVFPSLFAFKNRYCPFTMISKGLGASAPVTEDMLVKRGTIDIDGFPYFIPRYYKDRYLRKLQNENIPTCSISKDGVPSYTDSVMIKQLRVVYEPKKDLDGSELTCYMPLSSKLKLVDVPNPNFAKYHIPPQHVLDKYRCLKDLFDFEYTDVPLYVKKIDRYGNEHYLRALPKISEINDLSRKQYEYSFKHMLDIIESEYFNLPTLLQNSCSYDVPKILLDSRKYLSDSSDCLLFPSTLGTNIMIELEELGRIHSEWRAKSRLDKMERKREEKKALNAPYAKAKLSWEEYKTKSKYFSLFKN